MLCISSVLCSKRREVHEVIGQNLVLTIGVSGRLAHPMPIAANPMTTSQIGPTRRPKDTMQCMTSVNITWETEITKRAEEQSSNQERRRRPFYF